MKSTNINSCSSNDNENVTHKRVDSYQKYKFKCACGILYNHVASLNNHIDNKTKSVTCPRCSITLVGSHGLKRHFDTRGCRRGCRESRIDSNNSNVNNNDHNNNDINNNFDDDNENKDTSKSLLHAKSSTTSSSIPSNSRGIVIIVSYSILLLSLS